MPDEAIQVAVRVRPFNDREKKRKAVNIIEMPDGKKTGIRDPANMKAEPKWFTFDHSYWSHDGFKDNNGTLEGTSSKYADQVSFFLLTGKNRRYYTCMTKKYIITEGIEVRTVKFIYKSPRV